MPSPTKQSPPTRRGGPPPPPSPPAGVLGRIAPLEQDDRGIKILIYGVTATGKTTLWSTFPGPILAVIASGGIHPGELRSICTPANRDRIFQVALHTSHEMGELCQLLGDPKTNPYATVVLDHVSGFEDLVLRDVLGLQDVPVQRSWGLATREQYGTTGIRCREVFRSMLNLPCNVVFVGQERVSGDEAESSDVIAPHVGVALMPKLAGWLNPAVDYIGETFIRPKVVTTTQRIAGKDVTTTQRVPGQVEYCLRTGPHAVYTTKFRKPKDRELPEAIVDPDYDKILAIIRGE